MVLLSKEGIHQWVSPEFRYHGNPHGLETTLCPLKKNIKYEVLLAGAITILKNDGVRQWKGLIIPYMKWKIKMFQTTKQSI